MKSFAGSMVCFRELLLGFVASACAAPAPPAAPPPRIPSSYRPMIARPCPALLGSASVPIPGIVPLALARVPVPGPTVPPAQPFPNQPPPSTPATGAPLGPTPASASVSAGPDSIPSHGQNDDPLETTEEAREEAEPTHRPSELPFAVVVEIATVHGALERVLPNDAERANNGALAPATSFAEFLNGPNVFVSSVCQVLLKNGIPTETPCTLSCDRAAAPGQSSPCHQFRLTFRAQPMELRKVALELDLVPLQGAARAAHSVLALEDQHPALLGFAGSPSPRSEATNVVITPYLLRDKGDLMRLWQCKSLSLAPSPTPSAR